MSKKWGNSPLPPSFSLCVFNVLSYGWDFLEVLFIWLKQTTVMLQSRGTSPFGQNYFRSWINNSSSGVCFYMCIAFLTHILCMFHRKQASLPVLFWTGHGGPALGLLCLFMLQMQEWRGWREGGRRTWNMMVQKMLMLGCCKTLKWITNMNRKVFLSFLAERKHLASLTAHC